ncbi:MAG: efflux RND transporter periplasmic adaptor subunit, partial [Ensifer adhaerens]
LSLQELRLAQMTKLQSRDAATEFDVQQRQADVDNLRAQISNAEWELGKTTVRAPADGYVTNLALRKGARVTTLPLSPAMAFIDTSETIIGVEINQIDARYIEPGQMVEATFKFAPGETYTGEVEGVLQAIASGQARVSGTAVTPEAVSAAPFIVRVKLDDQAFAARLPAGATGDAAIFTDRVRAAHVIRRVLLRQIAITNYVNPF